MRRAGTITATVQARRATATVAAQATKKNPEEEAPDSGVAGEGVAAQAPKPTVPAPATPVRTPATMNTPRTDRHPPERTYATNGWMQHRPPTTTATLAAAASTSIPRYEPST